MISTNFEEELNKLHKDLRPLFSYDPLYLCFIRKCPNLLKNNMYN